MLDTKGKFSPLSSFLVPSAGHDAAASRPNGIAVDVSQGIKLELANGRNWEGYGDLFPSAFGLNSDYLSGTTAYAGVSFELTDESGFELRPLAARLRRAEPGSAEPLLARSCPTTWATICATPERRAPPSAGISPIGAALGLTASQSSGNAALLGVISGPIGAAGTADTLSLGISARVGFGEGWVTTIAYSGGVTQLDLSRNGLIANPETVRSRGFGLSLAKQGLFGEDALGISVSRPLQVYTGAIGAALAGNQARESDVELGYVTTFLDGTLALQANAAYQHNAAGYEGENAVTGVARAKLKF